MQALSAAKMALLRYLQCKDGLPDPKGSISSGVPAAAISGVNQQVQAASEMVREGFSKKMKQTVSETTLRSIKDAYMEEVRQKKRGGPSAGDVTALPSQKCGRLVLLGSSVDVMGQKYLKKVRDEEELCLLELQWQLQGASY